MTPHGVLIFTVEDRDPNTCGRCGRPGGADRAHACLNDDGSSVYFREKYGPPTSNVSGTLSGIPET